MIFLFIGDRNELFKDRFDMGKTRRSINSKERRQHQKEAAFETTHHDIGNLAADC